MPYDPSARTQDRIRRQFGELNTPVAAQIASAQTPLLIAQASAPAWTARRFSFMDFRDPGVTTIERPWFVSPKGGGPIVDQLYMYVTSEFVAAGALASVTARLLLRVNGVDVFGGPYSLSVLAQPVGTQFSNVLSSKGTMDFSDDLELSLELTSTGDTLDVMTGGELVVAVQGSRTLGALGLIGVSDSGGGGGGGGGGLEFFA